MLAKNNKNEIKLKKQKGWQECRTVMLAKKNKKWNKNIFKKSADKSADQ